MKKMVFILTGVIAFAFFLSDAVGNGVVKVQSKNFPEVVVIYCAPPLNGHSEITSFSISASVQNNSKLAISEESKCDDVLADALSRGFHVQSMHQASLGKIVYTFVRIPRAK